MHMCVCVCVCTLFIHLDHTISVVPIVCNMEWSSQHGWSMPECLIPGLCGQLEGSFHPPIAILGILILREVQSIFYKWATLIK